MSIKIEIDKTTQRRLNQSFKGLEDLQEDFMEGLIATLYKIKTRAQVRLRERKHIVTSRLRNSIYVKKPSNFSKDPPMYQDDNGNTFDAELKTVKLRKDEGAVGTNVEYADKIERLDSYLYWATKNVGKDVTDEIKKQAQENKRKYVR